MKDLITKLTKAALDVGGSLKADKKNKDQNYDYLSADKILSICGQALFAQGIAVIPEVGSHEVNALEYLDSYGKAKRRYDCRVTFVMTITDGADTINSPWLGMGSDYSVPDKALYKAITSGHKYFLMKLLCIGEGNEDSEHEPAEEGAPQKTPQPQKPAPNGTKPLSPEELEPEQVKSERPYPPSKVKEGMAEWAKTFKNFTPTEAQTNLLRYTLELLFAGEQEIEDKRHTVLKFLTGSASTKDISGSMFKALVEKWMKVKQDTGGEYTVDPMASREAHLIYVESLETEGQTKLF